MAINRWIKWALGAGAVLFVLVGIVVGAGLWYLSSTIGPDVTIGEAVPEVLLTTFDGQPVTLDQYKGQVVVVDLWSSW